MVMRMSLGLKGRWGRKSPIRAGLAGAYRGGNSNDQHGGGLAIHGGYGKRALSAAISVIKLLGLRCRLIVHGLVLLTSCD